MKLGEIGNCRADEQIQRNCFAGIMNKKRLAVWIYRLKYPFKLWAYELLDQWVMFSVPYQAKEKWLLFRLDLIGDYLMSRPFFKAAAQTPGWKREQGTFAGNQIYKELAEQLDGDTFGDFVWIDRARFINSLGYRYRVLCQIRRVGFSTVVYPSHTRQYWLESVVRVSGANTRITGKNVGFYMQPWEQSLTSSRYSQIIETGPIGLFEFFRNRNFFSALWPTATHIQSLLTDIETDANWVPPHDSPYFVLSPGASTANRMWPAERFAALARLVYQHTGWKVVVLGSKAEAELANTLTKLLAGLPVANLAGKLSLWGAMQVIKNAALLVGNESGPIHMAATTGTKAVCISQGNHFGRWNPYPKEVAPQIQTCYPKYFGHPQTAYFQLVAQYHDGSEVDIKQLEEQDIWIKIQELLVQTLYIQPS